MQILKIFVLMIILLLAFSYGMDLMLDIRLDNTLLNIKSYFQDTPTSVIIFIILIVAIFLVHIYSVSVKQKN